MVSLSRTAPALAAAMPFQGMAPIQAQAQAPARAAAAAAPPQAEAAAAGAGAPGMSGDFVAEVLKILQSAVDLIARMLRGEGPDDRPQENAGQPRAARPSMDEARAAGSKPGIGQRSPGAAGG